MVLIYFVFLDRVQVILDRLWVAQSIKRAMLTVVFFPYDSKLMINLSLSITMKGVMKFERRGKLSPRYIRPFEIIRIIRDVSYELDFPLVFSAIYPVFHISMLWYEFDMLR